jgi:hypothetical protein
MGRRQILKQRSHLGIIHGPLRSHSFRSELVEEAPREAACTIGLPAPALRKVPAALAVTSHDFGLTH